MATSNLKDKLQTVEMVIGIGMTFYLVWIMCPSVQSTVKGWVGRLLYDYRAQRAWEHARNRMAWETYLIKNADPSRLAEELEVEG